MISMKGAKMKSMIIMKKYTVDLAILFAKKRFFDLWSSQRPPASVLSKIE